MPTSRAHKAEQYLTEGRIRVIEHSQQHTLIYATGSDTEPYYVKRNSAGAWTCDCPARVTDCAHVLAARMIIPESTQATLSNFPTATDPDIDKLLEGL